MKLTKKNICMQKGVFERDTNCVGHVVYHQNNPIYSFLFKQKHSCKTKMMLFYNAWLIL